TPEGSLIARPAAPLQPAPPVLDAPAEKTAPQPQERGAPKIRVPFTAFEGSAQRIIIPVKVNDRVTVSMAMDTGAPGTVISFKLAAHLGVLREGDGALLTQTGGIGGRAPAVLLVLDSLAVHEARTEFVPATVTDLHTDAFEGLVGMDFLA